jgi:adenylyltransferase/sulfurtransferase
LKADLPIAVFIRASSAAEIPDCNEAGVLGVVPGIIGCRQALEVVKIITGIGKNLSGYLQILGLLNGEERKIKLKARLENQQLQSLQESYEQSCRPDAAILQPQQLQEWLRTRPALFIAGCSRSGRVFQRTSAQAQNLPFPLLTVL